MSHDLELKSIDLLSLSQKEIDRLIELSINLEENGVLHDAIAILKVCASWGDLAAITKLADVLSDHDEFRDNKLAESLYLKACMAGYFPACHNLGVLYTQLGRTVDAERMLNRAESLERQLGSGLPE